MDPDSADVDPPVGGRAARARRHLLAQTGAIAPYLGRMLRELLALGGERLLLLGAKVEVRADAARGAVLLSCARERGEARVEIAEPLLGGAEVALEGIPSQRDAGGECPRIDGGVLVVFGRLWLCPAVVCGSRTGALAVA